MSNKIEYRGVKIEISQELMTDSAITLNVDALEEIKKSIDSLYDEGILVDEKESLEREEKDF